MNEADHLKFQRIMKDYYKSQSERRDKQFTDLWDVSCQLLHAILDVELDGDAVRKLKALASDKIPEMEMILCYPGKTANQ